MTDPAAAELGLRRRAEDVVALAVDGAVPAMDVASALDELEAAALALDAAGVLPPDRSTAVVGEVVDALVVRGAAWLAPTVPDLDVTRLYDATSGSGARGPQLRRVVPVGATLDHGTITSVELWSDRAVARVVEHDGRVASSHVVGAAGVDDRRLDLRDASGGVVGVDLTGGRAQREAPGVVVPATVARHLDALVLLETARVRRDGSIEALNAARGRLAAAAAAIAPDRKDEALAQFDEAVATVPDAEPGARPVVLEVVPVAQRFFGGWLASLEVWSDHWRAVVVPEDPRSRWSWTAVDGRGHGFGGAALDAEILRFDPVLPLEWSSLVLERHGGGEVLEIEVTR